MLKKLKPIALFATALLLSVFGLTGAFAQLPGGSLDPTTVPQFEDDLVIPPVMPSKGLVYDSKAKKLVNYYEIEVVQFD